MLYREMKNNTHFAANIDRAKIMFDHDSSIMLSNENNK